MPNLSENYHLRKCFLEREQVPTQSLIKKKMTPPLAAIYFKSMNPKLKELAGLEPPLKGGGNDWFVSPEELLKGRAVLKPIKKHFLTKLTYIGIQEIGSKLSKRRHAGLNKQVEYMIEEGDNDCRSNVTTIRQEEWENQVGIAEKKNTELITNAFNHFSHLYRMSLDKIENIYFASTTAVIKKTREKAFQQMQSHYEAALKSQASTSYVVYEERLIKEKARLKSEFVEKIETCHNIASAKIHDLNVEKHLALEKLRLYFKRQTLACQIYVSLKERDECVKEMAELKHRHSKVVKPISDEITMKDFEIHLEKQKESRREEFSIKWHKKVCQVVKKFQLFVSYCLKMLPEYAEFFINMEKLMLLQVNEAFDDPTTESIIILEDETFYTPIPRPKPFYLFCDIGYKPRVDQDLCPKQSNVSSASELPVIIINKRCIYAACDNFDQFTNKIKKYIHGERGDDTDVKDELIYEHFVPVKYTSSQQLLEVKLENSLLRVLQEEIDYLNAEDKEAIKCSFCKLPWCSCTVDATRMSTGGRNNQGQASSLTLKSSEASNYKPLGRNMELLHEREPKWESFSTFMHPQQCACAKMAKKHLAEHLPVYMRRMTYDPPEIPNYEICSVTKLKTLVKQARNRNQILEAKAKVPEVKIPQIEVKDVSTQYSDQEYEALCTCFSDDELSHLLPVDHKTTEPSWVNMGRCQILGELSATYLTKGASSFAADRACSLKNLMDDKPDLQEIFMKKNCSFE